MTNVSCRQAAVAVGVLFAAIAAIAGGLLDRWALVGGAAAGGALYLAVVCARQRR